MKAKIHTITGSQKDEIELPSLFQTKIREDIVAKFLEAQKFISTQPYAPKSTAGKRHSASGTISHKRHDWKGHYGRGISRIPRKTMWRRGTNFFWIGAEVTSTRGGRKAHEPKLRKRIRKINRKEIILAMNSALAATTSKNTILKRYTTLEKTSLDFPLIIESKLEKIKTTDFQKALKVILKDTYRLALKNKTVRAGKGKSRGRKYKSNAGLLLITSEKENVKIKGIDTTTTASVSISDLYPLGRLTLFTENAIKELSKESKETKK